MNLVRRVRLALVAVIAAPLLAACTFTGDVIISDNGLYKVDLQVSESADVCEITPSQQLVQGLTFEAGDRVGDCRITGTASPALAAILGVNLTRDESGFRLTSSDGLGYWSAGSVDVTVHFPGPLTEVVGAEQTGPNELRVVYDAGGDTPVLTAASRPGNGPTGVEWAAGIGLVSGVALTLLVVGLRKQRRNRLLAAQLAGWPPPEGFGTVSPAPGPAPAVDDAFWSGAAQPRPPVVGERSKRPEADRSIWAPPQD
jgi:hypothetical protein